MILFENVTKKYRGTQRPALDNVNFEITRGEFVFIVGASGSGKSSCLRLILREEQPTGGRIHVLGHDLGKISSRKVPYFRRNLGVVFQDFRLLTNKTVYDNVAFSLQVIGKSRGFIQEAVPDTLKMVGLEGKEKRYPHELSGGEQQRVAIARAIVNKPSVLLTDEPTGNLDPATSLGIMQLLRAINAAGTTVVMATHEAAFVDIMKQRVIEISQGVIVRDEQRGGYGETAAIPLMDLSQAGVRTMRTTDDLVRQALAPQGEAAVEIPAVPGAMPVPTSESLSEPARAAIVVAETAAGEPVTNPTSETGMSLTGNNSDPDTAAVATPPALSPLSAAAQPLVNAVVLPPTGAPATPATDREPVRDIPDFLQPTPASHDSTAAAEHVLQETSAVPQLGVDDSLAQTATTDAQVSDAPASESPVFDERDPVRLAEHGGWAKRLGLDTATDDDQTDVGPVR